MREKVCSLLTRWKEVKSSKTGVPNFLQRCSDEKHHISFKSPSIPMIFSSVCIIGPTESDYKTADKKNQPIVDFHSKG